MKSILRTVYFHNIEQGLWLPLQKPICFKELPIERKEIPIPTARDALPDWCDLKRELASLGTTPALVARTTSSVVKGTEKDVGAGEGGDPGVGKEDEAEKPLLRAEI